MKVMITYDDVFLLCWAAFILFWVVSAFNVKRDISGGFGGAWRSFWLLRIIAAAVLVVAATRIAAGTAHDVGPGWAFSHGIFPENPVLDWTAAALAVVGLAFAIWARVNLGRNWSPRPAIKEQHELVTSGPYAYVRHPIYTGVLLMAFGGALTGSAFGIGTFVIALLVFGLRINKEERIMLDLFPNDYPEYQKKTKRLIPFVW